MLDHAHAIEQRCLAACKRLVGVGHPVMANTPDALGRAQYAGRILLSGSLDDIVRMRMGGIDAANIHFT